MTEDAPQRDYPLREVFKGPAFSGFAILIVYRFLQSIAHAHSSLSAFDTPLGGATARQIRSVWALRGYFKRLSYNQDCSVDVPVSAGNPRERRSMSFVTPQFALFFIIVVPIYFLLPLHFTSIPLAIEHPIIFRIPLASVSPARLPIGFKPSANMPKLGRR
jgi:hypothetical protein